MCELAYAARERAILNAIPNVTLSHATDPVQYHILLGLACTAGSAFGYTPPSLSECWESLVQAHDKRDKQAVQMHRGGKAFTKHSHRASSGWWGVSTGTNADKNASAEAAYNRIWSNASWRNVFWLPHRVLAYEVRVKEGYGLRFQQDTKLAGQDGQWMFRGFVEPPMEGDAGHKSKWRH